MNGRNPSKPEFTVFYAWQADRDKKSNRYLIQKAAEEALERIGKDSTTGCSMILDHDTLDVPGTPAVTDTILQKIGKATIFLADLTYVAQTEPSDATGKKKSVPNPNVLFELGYAFKVLGSERIICVMNDAYGKAEEQIFDLAHRRWPLSYELVPDDQSRRATEKNSLSNKIEQAVRAILKSDVMTAQVLSRRQTQEKCLQDWVDYGKNRWRQVITEQLPHERPSRYERGVWIAAYSIIDEFHPAGVKDFKNILKRVERQGTHWPVWDTGSERIKSPLYFCNDRIECWIDDGGYSEFWIGSPYGSMFLVRPYREDFDPNLVDPGKVLWIDSTVIQVAECLLHARRLAQIVVNEPSSIYCSFEWGGLSNRGIRPSTSLRGKSTPFWDNKICRQALVQSPIHMMSTNQIDENINQVIEDLTRPLFLAFQMPDSAKEWIDKTVTNLQKSLL